MRFPAFPTSTNYFAASMCIHYFGRCRTRACTHVHTTPSTVRTVWHVDDILIPNSTRTSNIDGSSQCALYTCAA